MAFLGCTPLCAKTFLPILRGSTCFQFTALFTQTGAWKYCSGNGVTHVPCTTSLRKRGYGSRTTRKKWKPLLDGQIFVPMVRITFLNEGLSITGNALLTIRPDSSNAWRAHRASPADYFTKYPPGVPDVGNRLI